jgi:hypothetical protein
MKSWLFRKVTFQLPFCQCSRIPPQESESSETSPPLSLKLLSTKTTCPLRLDFLCCLCSSPDQRLNPDRSCGHWKGTLAADKLTFQLKKDSMSWQADLSAEKVLLSADKLTFQLKMCLISWQADFSAEKVLFSADKLTFQLKRYLISWQADFSAEKVLYQLKSWLFSWKSTLSAKKLTFQLKR